MKEFNSESFNNQARGELEQERVILDELESELLKNSIEALNQKNQTDQILAKLHADKREAEQEKEILSELNILLSINQDRIEQIKKDHETSHTANIRTINELENQKEFLVQLNQSFKDVIEKLKASNDSLQENLTNSEKKYEKLHSESIEQGKIIKEQAVHLNKKQSAIISLAAVGICAIALTSFLFLTAMVGQQYKVEKIGTMQTGYVIQNLKGDTIDTWLSWRLVSGTPLHIGITNAQKYPDKILLIKEVIESEQAIQIDDSLLQKGPKGSTSTYYLGWQGALKNSASTKTLLYIPTDLTIIDSPHGEGEITITLTDDKSGDGYSGFTKSIADDSQNQILKSTITIYSASTLQDEQFKAILRHEIGHALGLGHSSAQEELMAPNIVTAYPYISDCDIKTLVNLYDGSKNSQVTCDK